MILAPSKSCCSKTGPLRWLKSAWLPIGSTALLADSGISKVHGIDSRLGEVTVPESMIESVLVLCNGQTT